MQRADDDLKCNISNKPILWCTGVIYELLVFDSRRAGRGIPQHPRSAEPAMMMMMMLLLLLLLMMMMMIMMMMMMLLLLRTLITEFIFVKPMHETTHLA